MMGASLKNDGGSVTLRIAGGGPAGSVLAVGDAQGNARVTVANPVVELPLNDRGKLDVGGAVGRQGTLSVVRDHGFGQPQTGFTPIVTGEIGDDLASYFALSEQIPTVCALGVLVAPDLTVAAAGGYLLQLLPGAGDDTIARIERNLPETPAVTAMTGGAMTPAEMLSRVLGGFSLQVLEERRVLYRCNCSRARVLRVLAGLGRRELERLAGERETTEVECHFCDKRYHFSADVLLGLAGEQKA
jgi:molecular chaperone Hsp33